LGRLAFVTVAALTFLQLIGFAGGPLDRLWVRGLVKVGLWVVPAAALTWWLARRQAPAAWRSLGLQPLAGRGIAVSLAATLPFGLAWAIDGRAAADADTLLGDVLLGPFAEEVLFRGFLFLGLRHLGWRLWSAGLVSALAFGAAHVPSLAFLWDMLLLYLYSGEAGYLESFSRTALAAGAILLQVAAGGLLFAWVCERWQSLWPAIALHMAINFWWIVVFGPEATVSPSIWSATPWTVASALSVAATIALTLRYTRAPAPARPARRRARLLADDSLS
jgi:membrane protease YdiL (CAAX protease family)